MALFSLSFNPPSVCPKIPRNSAIQRPLRSKTTIPVTPYFEIPKFSISAPIKTLNNKPKYRSILNSHVELEEEPPTNVIIFVKDCVSIQIAIRRVGSINWGGRAEGIIFSIWRIKVVLDKKTKQSLGFAYVWFMREEHARTAVEEMNGQFFQGRFIHVVIAKPGSCKTRPEPSPYKF